MLSPKTFAVQFEKETAKEIPRTHSHAHTRMNKILIKLMKMYMALGYQRKCISWRAAKFFSVSSGKH